LSTRTDRRGDLDAALVDLRTTGGLDRRGDVGRGDGAEETTGVAGTDGWPLYGLRPKDEKDLQGLYDGLKEKAKSNPNFEVYLRDVDMPERYHFSNNHRIAPLWIVPKTGWAIVTKKEFDVKEGKEKGLVYHPRGLHGYDHEHPLMRAIFIARGPAFPHPANSELKPFRKYSCASCCREDIG